MTDQQIEAAEAVIAAAENGTYDTQLGIDPAQRAALDKARGGDAITLGEFKTLVALGEHELADQAHRENRIVNLYPTGDNA